MNYFCFSFFLSFSISLLNTKKAFSANSKFLNRRKKYMYIYTTQTSPTPSLPPSPPPIDQDKKPFIPKKQLREKLSPNTFTNPQLPGLRRDGAFFCFPFLYFFSFLSLFSLMADRTPYPRTFIHLLVAPEVSSKYFLSVKFPWFTHKRRRASILSEVTYITSRGSEKERPLPHDPHSWELSSGRGFLDGWVLEFAFDFHMLLCW